MIQLHYKASNIAQAEQELNANFFSTLEGLGAGVPSFTALLMILRAGGLSKDEADNMLDEKGIEVALKEAIEALGKAGFLAKLKTQANEIPSESAETSMNSGNKTKL